jgi:hypothetical protein
MVGSGRNLTAGKHTILEFALIGKHHDKPQRGQVSFCAEIRSLEL